MPIEKVNLNNGLHLERRGGGERERERVNKCC